MAKLSEAIYNIRKALGTQQRAAEILGIKRNTISQYETGIATPSSEVLMRFFTVAPPSPSRQVIHEEMVRRMKTDMPEYPRLAEAVFEDLATREILLTKMAPKKVTGQHDRFASLVQKLLDHPIDKSINEILENWFLFGGRATVPIFREAAKYIQMRLELTRGVRKRAEAGRKSSALQPSGTEEPPGLRAVSSPRDRELLNQIFAQQSGSREGRDPHEDRKAETYKDAEEHKPVRN